MLTAILVGSVEKESVSRLFFSAMPPRIAAACGAGFAFNTVEHVLQPFVSHENTATMKRRESRRLLRGRHRDLLEQTIHGRPHRSAHGTILLPRDSFQPLHHGIRREHLNFLHGYMP